MKAHDQETNISQNMRKGRNEDKFRSISCVSAVIRLLCHFPYPESMYQSS